MRTKRETASINIPPKLIIFKGLDTNSLKKLLIVLCFSNAVWATNMEAEKINPAITGLIP